PGEFISLAEHSGFIRQLSDFVLTEAIAQLHAWRAVGINVPVAVNLSAHVLREPQLLRRLLDTIGDSGLPPGALVVELTESAIMSLARNLGIKVVGEGIERVAEWQTMAGTGCDVAQGFLISRALPADEATALLATGEPLIETFAIAFGVDAPVH